VQENVPGLDFITRLRPVTYHLDIHKQNEMCNKVQELGADWDSKYDIEQKQMTGFIAQEVAQAAVSVGYDFSGVQQAPDEVGMYSLSYAAFTVPLVKAVQELADQVGGQQDIIESLQSENAAMKSQLDALSSLQSEVAELKALMTTEGSE
jgi:hypothetical protein